MSTQLTLSATSVAEMMSRNPISIAADANVSEAIGLLVDRGFHAAPVIDEAGRPIGVVSTGDILRHDREYARHLAQIPGMFEAERIGLPSGERLPTKGFQVETIDSTPVRDIMTPAVFTVPTTATPAMLVKELVEKHVHRIFVVDQAGILVGVVTTVDVLKRLK
jgi:CBS domain-containing protein